MKLMFLYSPDATREMTSRRVISVTVVEDANEITQLVKILRGYLR